MKKLFTIITVILFSTVIKAQTVQAVLVSSGANKVTVYCKPSATINNVILSNITIVISIPKQVTNPTITVTNKYGFTGLAWIAADNNANAEVAGHNAPFVDPAPGGRAYYTFFGNDLTATYGTPTNWLANTTNPVADFTFSDRSAITDAEIHIDDLSSGSYGSGSPTGVDSYWYITQTGIGDVTDITNMFLGTGAVNSPGGLNPSFSPLQPLSFLPVIFQDFNVSKKGKSDAFLTWTTNTEQNVSHFVLERSTSQQSGWAKVAEVKAKGNSNTPTNYSYTDINVYDGSQASKVIFYRIRSVDIDGKQTIFPTRSIKFTATGDKSVGVYPNPAREGFTLTIPLQNPQSTSKILLKMVNRLGQVVNSRQINADIASNYYYDVKTSGITNGEYLLQVILDGELLDTKKIIVQR